MTEEDNEEESSISELAYQVREAKHKISNLDSRQTSVEKLLVAEFGDGTRPGALNQKLAMLERLIDRVVVAIEEIKDVVTGDGKVQGLAEQVRTTNARIDSLEKQMDKRLLWFYGIAGTVISSLITAYLLK